MYYLSYEKNGNRHDYGKAYNSPEDALADAEKVNTERARQGLPLVTRVVDRKGQKVADVSSSALSIK